MSHLYTCFTISEVVCGDTLYLTRTGIWSSDVADAEIFKDHTTAESARRFFKLSDACVERVELD